ncbi:sorting nexin-10B [Boleophthalmus pectinirostris]|uniref:sorting nexin-10B n=1 Tax=Boleophthalmus pectinirostris TaxID=150288 RepID=UPI000A1C6750|nr:sorting nexin-10B [Boleophthalmus pectinirostris]
MTEDTTTKQQTISVWVRDPRIQKNDFWHAYIDYEICLHTNSVCFTKKTSSVRRRYSEFVWLRQKLEANSLLMIKLPELPPKNPFFSLNNARQITERMTGLQRFLEQILQSPLLLSDSCLHLFLQSQLSVNKMEACAEGRTPFSVSQAVQRCGLRRFHSDEDLHKNMSLNWDSDSSECTETEPSLLNKSQSAALFRYPELDQEDSRNCTCESA